MSWQTIIALVIFALILIAIGDVLLDINKSINKSNKNLERIAVALEEILGEKSSDE